MWTSPKAKCLNAPFLATALGNNLREMCGNCQQRERAERAPTDRSTLERLLGHRSPDAICDPNTLASAKSRQVFPATL